jgi:hypothetical protein
MIITQSETINFPPFHPNSKFPPIPPDKNKKIYQKFPCFPHSTADIRSLPGRDAAPPVPDRRPLPGRDAATSLEAHAAQLCTDQLPSAAHVQLRQAHAARLLRRLTTAAPAEGIRKKSFLHQWATGSTGVGGHPDRNGFSQPISSGNFRRRWPPWPAGRGWDQLGRRCRPDSSGWSGVVGTACWADAGRWAAGGWNRFVRAAAVDFGILRGRWFHFRRRVVESGVCKCIL